MYYVEAVAAALAAGAITAVVGGQIRKPKSKPASLDDADKEPACTRKLGVYHLFWRSGGSSVAAVGQLDDGTLWYAPANWTSHNPHAIASTDWSLVSHASLITTGRES